MGTHDQRLYNKPRGIEHRTCPCGSRFVVLSESETGERPRETCAVCMNEAKELGEKLAKSGCAEEDQQTDFFTQFLRGIGGIPKFPDGLEEMGLSEDSPVEEFVEKAMWGTYGKPRTSTLRLCDLSTEHLEAILASQRQISMIYSRTILLILRNRRQGIFGTVKQRLAGVLNAF